VHMSETLLHLLSSGKGFRSEAYSGSGERDLDEVLHHEFFALCNNDIAATLVEQYYYRYCRPENQEAWDTIKFYAEYDWEAEGDDPWFELKYDLLEAIPKVLHDIVGKDVKYCLWVAEKDFVAQHYASGKTNEIDCYDLSKHVAVLSDLGQEGCLLAFLQCPKPIVDKSRNVHEPFACVNMYDLGDLYHVGTMDISKKRNFSMEGDGLSVSICPDEWCRITEGHTHGDYFLLSKPDMKLLDYYALTDDEKDMIQTWAIENGYAVKGTVYQSIQGYDEEGYEYFSVYDNYDTALMEADFEEDQVRKMEGLLPTQKFQDQSLVQIELINFPDLIAELYAEKVLDYDGVYWNEVLDVASYSAPRGVIFNSKLPTFAVTNTTQEIETPRIPDVPQSLTERIHDAIAIATSQHPPAKKPAHSTNHELHQR